MKGVKSEVVVVVAMEAIAVGIGEIERLCSSLLVRILWILFFFFLGPNKHFSMICYLHTLLLLTNRLTVYSFLH
jgi:hypothetical protein